mmetsp:Transcript_54751/g.166358  ORF Transcript_54751/g.166358 Transcript_54751/m.166358 type:complete len:468 (+) Transcript_54751:833-2236(+)
MRVLHRDANLLRGLVQHRAEVDLLVADLQVGEHDLADEAHVVLLRVVLVMHNQLLLRDAAHAVHLEGGVELHADLCGLLRPQEQALRADVEGRVHLQEEFHVERRRVLDVQRLAHGLDRRALLPHEAVRQRLSRKLQQRRDEISQELRPENRRALPVVPGELLAHEGLGDLARLGRHRLELEAVPTLGVEDERLRGHREHRRPLCAVVLRIPRILGRLRRLRLRHALRQPDELPWLLSAVLDEVLPRYRLRRVLRPEIDDLQGFLACHRGADALGLHRDIAILAFIHDDMHQIRHLHCLIDRQCELDLRRLVRPQLQRLRRDRPERILGFHEGLHAGVNHRTVGDGYAPRHRLQAPRIPPIQHNRIGRHNWPDGVRRQGDLLHDVVSQHADVDRDLQGPQLVRGQPEGHHVRGRGRHRARGLVRLELGQRAGGLLLRQNLELCRQRRGVVEDERLVRRVTHEDLAVL